MSWFRACIQYSCESNSCMRVPIRKTNDALQKMDKDTAHLHILVPCGVQYLFNVETI